jgi:hypothetical protein
MRLGVSSQEGLQDAMGPYSTGWEQAQWTRHQWMNWLASWATAPAELRTAAGTAVTPPRSSASMVTTATNPTNWPARCPEARGGCPHGATRSRGSVERRRARSDGP